MTSIELKQKFISEGKWKKIEITPENEASIFEEGKDYIGFGNYEVYETILSNEEKDLFDKTVLKELSTF